MSLRTKNRKTIRIFAGFLAILMLLGGFPGTIRSALAAETNAAWDGNSRSIPESDEEGVFLIRTASELAWFSDHVNEGHIRANARLMNSITMNSADSSYRWTPIGSSEKTPFRGNFDGNGKQIQRLYVEVSPANRNQTFGGLFGVVDGGTVENVSVSGTIVNKYENSGSSPENMLLCGTGAVAGYLKSGYIIGCTNNCDIRLGNYSFFRNAGGIAGISSGIILRCTNNGSFYTTTVGGQYHVGGIAGLMYGADAQTYYCDNYGFVAGFFKVGGITGSLQNGGEIQGCVNYGSLSGSWYVGGIVGFIGGNGTTSDGSVRECLVGNVYSLGGNITASNFAGGIAGEMGYADGEEKDHPPMPVIINAYSTMTVSPKAENRAAIAAHLKSGELSNVYGLADTELKPVAMTEASAVHITGTSAMFTQEQLKSGDMPGQLGDAFVFCSIYFEDLNNGYPMLAWQIQSSSAARAVNDGVKELDGYLTAENRKRYGENYTLLENIVQEYTKKLSKVRTRKECDSLLEEARTKLQSVVPGTDVDNELMDAIDNAVIKLDEYRLQLEKRYPMTDDRKMKLEEEYIRQVGKIENAGTASEVQSAYKEGKSALNAMISDFEESRLLEMIKESALAQLVDYRTGPEPEEPWRTDILTARNKGIRLIKGADSAKFVWETLAEAKAAIDAAYSSVKDPSIWNGEEKDEPDEAESGVYLISTAAELAWFAEAVNNGNTKISAILTEDISLGNVEWTPIGDVRPFEGSFDGCGHSIRDLKITDGKNAAGLFGYVGGSDPQTIANLTVYGEISCSSDTRYAGGIAACSQSSNMTWFAGCHSYVSISINRFSQYEAGCGGIVGKTMGTTITHCSNEGRVAIPADGINGATCFAGGLIGVSDRGTYVDTSFNSGKISATYAAGGLVGGVVYSNTGSGLFNAADCYNAGTVDCGMYAGGLIGDAGAKTCLTCCYSYGAVNPGTTGIYPGALFGKSEDGEHFGLYALKRAEQPERALIGGGTIANGSFVSSEEITLSNFVNRLNANGPFFIPDYLRYQNGYPILSWELSIDEFRYGASSELRNMVSCDDYTEENMNLVSEIIEEAVNNIASAGSMDEIASILGRARADVSAVETKEEAAERLLDEAKNREIDIISAYADEEQYREEEKLLIREYVKDGIKWILSAENEEEVLEYAANTKENIDLLPTALQYQYETDSRRAERVTGLIDAIGEVIFTAYVRTSINIARASFDDLSDVQQTMVPNYQILLDAEEEYARLEEEYGITEEDELLAQAVDELILAIGEVTADSREVIETARAAYDGLKDAQKAIVTHPELLFEAEDAYDLIKAQEVSAAISSIGPVTGDSLELIAAVQGMYDALTERQKYLVDNYQILLDAATDYEDLTAAERVTALIEKIGSVTLESGPEITAAIRAYNSLTGQQQELVGNYALLEEAAAAYDELFAVANAIDLINRIGVVSSGSEEAIRIARTAYNALTPAQQSLVGNYEVLVNAETAYLAIRNGGTEAPGVRENARTMADTYGLGTGGTSGTAENGEETPEPVQKIRRPVFEPESEAAEENAGEKTGILDTLAYDYDKGGTEEAAALSEKGEVPASLWRLLLIAILCAAAVLTGAIAIYTGNRKREDKRMNF